MERSTMDQSTSIFINLFVVCMRTTENSVQLLSHSQERMIQPEQFVCTVVVIIAATVLPQEAKLTRGWPDER